MQTNRVRYAQVGAGLEKPMTLRYTVDKGGELVSTEVDPREKNMSMCFKDMQKLELIHEKLLVCSAILSSSVEIATGCLEYCNGLEAAVEVREASCHKLRLCIRRFDMHARAIDLARKQCERTSQLVSTNSPCCQRDFCNRSHFMCAPVNRHS
jgi:hypothetical protein